MPNPEGRPRKFTDPDKMQRVIDLYFLACQVHQDPDKAELLDKLNDEDLLVINDITDVYPTISGIAYTLNMSTECFRNYGTDGDKDEFFATVKQAKQRVEMHLEQRLNGQSVTGSIFSLKNNFGWKDQQDVNLKGKVSIIASQTDEDI